MGPLLRLKELTLYLQPSTPYHLGIYILKEYDVSFVECVR